MCLADAVPARAAPGRRRARRPDGVRPAAWRLAAALVCALAAAPGAAAADAAAGLACAPQGGAVEGLLACALFSPELDRVKRLYVLLPSGYEAAPEQRYPVLYMNDGQDLFDLAAPDPLLDAAFAADLRRQRQWEDWWRLEEVLPALAAAGRLAPMIVVGVASDDGRRSLDLAPWPWPGAAEVAGPAYADFVADRLKPAIDAAFRTRPEPEATGIGGSSLGAVMALYLGVTRPDRFGRVLALSPLLTEATFAPPLRALIAGAPGAAALRVIVETGDAEPEFGPPEALRAAFAAAGLSGDRLRLAVAPGGRHDVASWARRLPAALTWLWAEAPEP